MQTIILVGIVLLPVLYSLYKGFEAYREIWTPGEFFVYPSEFTSEKLRNSITSSNVSLGAAIFAFLGLGYSFRLGAVLFPLTWLLGYLLLLWVFPRIGEIETGRTLHGFLAKRFGSRPLGYLASVASIIGFLGVYGVEVPVVLKLFRALLHSSEAYLALGFLMAVIVTAYTALGGFKAASHADTLRLLGTSVGILCALGYSVYLAVNRGAEHDPCKILALLPQNLDLFCKTLSMTDSVTSSCFVLSGRI